MKLRPDEMEGERIEGGEPLMEAPFEEGVWLGRRIQNVKRRTKLSF